MHAQRPSRGGDVTVVSCEHGLQMLPFQASNGHRLFGYAGVGVSCGHPMQRSNNIFGPGWLGQVMASTQLYCFDRRGDAGVAGQHDNAHGRVSHMQVRDGSQAGFISEAQVHYCIVGAALRADSVDSFEIVGDERLKLAAS